MDLGLDVEAYRDYINNLEQFAHFNPDFEIYAREQLYFDAPENREMIELKTGEQVTEDMLDKTARFKFMKNNIENTLRKLKRHSSGFLNKRDQSNLKEFIKDMRLYLNDMEIYSVTR